MHGARVRDRCPFMLLVEFMALAVAWVLVGVSCLQPNSRNRLSNQVKGRLPLQFRQVR